MSLLSPNPTSNGAILLRYVKRGEYVRLTDTTTSTWVRGAYDRATDSYELSHAEDMNRSVYRKGSTTVYVGFTY